MCGASNLTYAEATWTQKLADWTGAHVRMFRFFGGAPRLLVPDNLKSGVAKASFYDPEINRTYRAMAAHYSVGVLPARPYKPRDKAKVEAGVRFAQSWILGRLRHQTFFSLAECNATVALALQRSNYPPIFLRGDLRRFQARTPRMTSKGFAPLSRAVSTVVRTSASALAAHMARLPLVTFRWITQGRSLRSEPLLVGSTSPP